MQGLSFPHPFKIVYLILQHLQESHSAEVEATWLKCKYCSKLCPDDASMRSHVTQSHKSAMTCNNCSETFEAMAELIEHVNEVQCPLLNRITWINIKVITITE